MIQVPGVDLIKLFVVNLLKLFCKLDHFINANNNGLSGVKQSSLQTKVRKFMTKSFIRPTPVANFITFLHA